MSFTAILGKPVERIREVALECSIVEHSSFERTLGDEVRR